MIIVNQAQQQLRIALISYGRLLIFNSPYKTKFTNEILQQFLDEFILDELIHGRMDATNNLFRKLEA
jgi:hypothetical protein